MKKFWINILILTGVITLIPVGFGLLQEVVLGTNSNAAFDLTEVIAFTLSITFILTLSNSKIIDFVRERENIFKNKFSVRIAFLLGAVSLSAAVIMFCFTLLWRYFSSTDVTFEPEDYFYNVVIAVVISIVVTGIMESKNIFELWKESLMKESKLREQNLMAELELLKNQLKPHFLFNTLNSIYVQSAKDPHLARESILRFSDLLSHRLYESKKEFLPLEEEINYLKNYIEIEKTRQGDAVQISASFWSEPQTVRVAPLLFAPLVENAFKYGLKSGLDSYFIDISLDVQGDQVVFICRNNYETSSKTTRGGLGIKNLEDRLQLIYGSDYEFNITDTGNLYRAELIIPVK